jgi:hypothetical protein
MRFFSKTYIDKDHEKKEWDDASKEKSKKFRLFYDQDLMTACKKKEKAKVEGLFTKLDGLVVTRDEYEELEATKSRYQKETWMKAAA